MRKLTAVFIILCSASMAQSPMVRGTLGSAYVLLGKLASANMNVTTDQSVTITVPGGSSKYQVASVVFTNCSANIAGGTAAGSVYSAASKGGTALYSTATVYTSLSTTTITYQPAITIAVSLTGNVFFSLTTGNGSAGTCDLYVFGVPLP